MMLSLVTLGELKLVEAAAGAELLAGRRKELVLLAYIARSRPRAVPRSQLAALLWGDRPEAKARSSLRQALLHLKRVLGEHLHTVSESVSLDDEELELDLAVFESALAEDRFADAVAQWHGDFLRGAEDLGAESCRLWIEDERQRLRNRLAWAFEQLVSEATRRGAYGEAVRWAAQWTESSPLDEKAQTHFVHALRMYGRIGEARAQHAAFLARYRETFECEPPAKILRLASELEVAPTLANPSQTSAPPPNAAPLVGRSAAFRELVTAWENVQAGSGAVVLIEADEGLGKTRLLEEFTRWLLTQDPQPFVLSTAASADQQGEPWSVLGALFARIADAPGLIGISPEMLGELSRLVPAIRAEFPRLPPPHADEFPLREAVVEAVSSIGNEVPIVLVVDDADRADAATMRSLAALTARIDGCRMLLALSARPQQSDRDWAMPAGFRRDSRVRVVRLARLTVEEVGSLMAAALPGDHPSLDSLVASLWADTDGNPRFIVDTINALVTEKRLRRDERGVWQLAPPLADRPLPLAPSVRAAVGRRLAAVTPEAREVAETIAIASVLDLETLARVRRLSTASACAAVEELVQQRLVIAESPDHPGQLVCASDSTRRTIALTVPGERRIALQTAIGRPGAPATQVEGAEPPVAPMPNAFDSKRVRARRWRLATWSAAAAVALIFVGIATKVLAARRAREPDAVVAIGLIRDLAAPDSAVGGALADMLATNLARVPKLHVLSNARMLEVVRQLQVASGRGMDSTPSRETMWHAALAAGAGEVIEGELYREQPAVFRLDLRRVDAASGIVRYVATVRGVSVFQLVDEATARLASGSVTMIDTLRVADVTTSSLAAYRFYEEGLRALYQDGDAAAAKRLFQAAAREDSTFAMAPYYLALIAGGGPGEAWVQFERADRLAEHASDRERLLIRTKWAFERNDPAAAAFAETLAVRYPNEPDPMLAMAGSLIWSGRFLEAIPITRRVLAMDSLTRRGANNRSAKRPPNDPAENSRASGGPRCLGCEALTTLAMEHWQLDSMDAGIEDGQEVIRLRPRSGSWNMLAWAYEYAERYPEALESFRRARELGNDNIDALASMFFVTSGIRSGDFPMADKLLEGMIASGTDGVEWWDAISLRHQGRLAEALVHARRERAREERLDTTHIIAFDGAVMEALVLFEMGHGREAAARFDSIATRSAPRTEALQHRAARHRAWMLTHAASSLAAAGDTALLPRLADSVQALGNQSSYGRDQRLHHHVRGLLLAARGQWGPAVSEFRQAIYSWTFGYTRTNLELGRALLVLNRPREAIAALRPALHGPLDASNLYVTRTELQEQLAGAFDAAGERDSARVYYVRVANAWRHADPQFSVRRRRAVARAFALGATALDVPDP